MTTSTQHLPVPATPERHLRSVTGTDMVPRRPPDGWQDENRPVVVVPTVMELLDGAAEREAKDREQSRKPSFSAMDLLGRHQLADLPQPEPLIDNTLDLGTVAVLAGYWGTFKSFIAMDWASCVATGKPWQGREALRDSVLYVATEGAHGMHNRLTAWEMGWQRHIPSAEWVEMDRPAGFQVLPCPVQLANPHALEDLCALVVGGGYKLVIIDTLARCLLGLDENSSRDIGIIIDALYQLRDATGIGTVLAVHHTGKDKVTVRGSSALESGVDTVYLSEGDSALIKLHREKRKDGPTEDVHFLKFQPIPGSDSGVMEARSTIDNLTDKQAELWSKIMSTFSDTGAGRKDLEAIAGMPHSTFLHALNSLVKKGALINTGTNARPFYQIPTS